ncbi:hypothetical protein FRB90_008791, partial [Tulasnella sp. 427]
TKADEETLTKLREIGPVKYVVAPDVFHWLNLENFSRAFPDAKVIGVDGLEPKVPGVKWGGIYGKDPEGTEYGYESEISARYFSHFENKDVAFFHHDSKTLVVADLIFNFPPTEQYSKSGQSPTSWIPLVSKIGPFSKLHGLLTSSLAKDIKANAPDAKAVNEWDFDTIIPCHGNSLVGNGKAAWQAAWGKYINYKD